MTTISVDQFTARSLGELMEIANARGLEVPADADAPALRRLLREYQAVEHVGDGLAIASAQRRQTRVDDLQERIDADVRRVLDDGSRWTVRGIRAATFHSGEEVRGSLLRIAARADGSGFYHLPTGGTP